jgi:NAD(P)-dependent dehydrogenase (short-subunit alcohol dehydrogenase family)
MQQAELRQIRGIGAAMCERLGRDHGIEAIADLARLSDTEVDELQRALQAGRSHVRNGDVARWRDHARQLVSEGETVADEPLATFVVEVWKPARRTGRSAPLHCPPRRGR